MQKGFAIPLILVGILVVGLIIGGYFVYTNFQTVQITQQAPNIEPIFQSQNECEKKTEKKCSLNLCQVSEGSNPPDNWCKPGWYTYEPSPSPTDEIASPDSIGANWKSYKNEEYGFELKYPGSYKSIELRPTGEEKKIEVVSFKIEEINFLTVKVFKDSLGQYKLIDQPAGAIYRFDTRNNRWVIDGTGEPALNAVKRMESSLEAYLYHSGDGLCVGDFIIIPHSSSSYVVEVDSISCGIEDVNGGYKKNPNPLDPKQILGSFKFLK